MLVCTEYSIQHEVFGCACSKLQKAEKGWRFSRRRHTVVGMITISFRPRFPCVYRKPKPARNGDEVRQGWRVS
jgi:hypothetical protein